MKYLFLLCIICSCSLNPQEVFYNPLLESGADPYAFYHSDGYYYYTNTLGNRLDLWRTRDLTDLKNAERKTVFVPSPNTAYSKNLWAPEVTYLRGTWYFYFAADDGDHVNHRMYALENSSQDPFQGRFVMKGKVSSADDNWAIDGGVFEHNGALFMIWSGWETTPWVDYEIQRIYKVFLIYSASGCWTPHYKLGMLEADAERDLLDPASWKKHEEPVFTQSEENRVYGPGHNAFFTSPDGKEDWILYHANDRPDQGCGRFRKPRAQRIAWTPEGYPVFGEALSTSTAVEKPSGTIRDGME